MAQNSSERISSFHLFFLKSDMAQMIIRIINAVISPVPIQNAVPIFAL